MQHSTRIAAIACGAALLTGVTSFAMAQAKAEHGTGDVTVNVSIEPLPGELTMSIGGTSTTLEENGSDASVRVFTGTLPTVTITDSRNPGQIAGDAGWYVMGSVTEFKGNAGQPAIGAGHLGWSPRLINGSASDGVAEGGDVGTVLDPDPGDGSNVGLVDKELLALAINSGDILGEHEWTATADLSLKTEATVAAGDYSATLTLSLFE